MKNIPILFENTDCLILNKPAGLPVQGGAGVSVSLDSLLTESCAPGCRPLLVHRLDKDTSGIILVAKHPAAAARLARLVARRGMVKQYLAVTAGTPDPPTGTIRLALDVKGAPGQVQRSCTRYRLRSVMGGNALVELELGTGRMHQIRRHLAAIGHPVLGDDKYGDFSLNKRLRKTQGLKRLLLHASRLVIAGPDAVCAGFEVDVSAPLPPYFDGFV